MFRIDDVESIIQVFVTFGLFIWIISYIYFGFSSVVSEKIWCNFNCRYFESIVQKDNKWFDENNSHEFPTKIIKLFHSIQRATGKKFIMIVNAYITSAAGFVIAFILGWIYAFSLLIIVPFIFLSVFILEKGIQQRQIDKINAYTKSGTYAEHALNAIKVVSAFGQEEPENKAYNSFLEQSKNR